MKSMRRLLGLMVACILCVTMMPIEALARSVITSVSIKVVLRLQPGDTLPSDIDTSENLSSSEYGCSVTVSSSKFYIEDVEWVTSKSREIHVGDTAEMKVTLAPHDADDYYFKGSYGSSNVTVKGGSYVSSSRKGENLVVKLRTDPMKGEYDAPDDAYWKDSGLGHARWVEADNSSGYYDVYLYRGSNTVKKLEGYRGTSYNFYPYMTSKGTYHFKVRSVPRPESGSSAGKKSDWIESDEIYISEEDVSDGSGQEQNQNQTSVGWLKQGDIWFYRYPDGSYQKDSWMQLNGYWYLFDSEGRMLKGWQERNGQTYLLRDSGEMLVGWYLKDNAWYYFNPTPGPEEGALCRNVWIQYNDKIYYMNQHGIMAQGWTQVGENWYYFYPGEGSRAVNTTIDGFFVDGDGVWRR